MKKSARWLLVITLGLQVHMLLVMFAMNTLNGSQSFSGMKAMVLPFGQLTHSQVTTVATIEWIIIFILWIAFAVVLLRQPSE